MKSKLIPLLALIFHSLVLSGLYSQNADKKDGESLILSSEGKSEFQIVIPDDYPAENIKKSVDRAAKLLQETFAKNGAELEIVTESNSKTGKPGIYIGQTEFAKSNGIPFSKMEGWSYAFKVVDGNLIVAGNDAVDPIPLEKRREREASRGGIPMLGTLKAVTDFVYDYAGVRFLFPGKEGVEFLPMETIEVPKSLDLARRPYGQNIEIPRSDDLYFFANGLEPQPLIHSNYGHYHNTVITPEKYGEEHPEYFVFHSGKRDNKNDHLCLSNPEVQELIYQSVLKDCDTGYDIVEMGQIDGYRPCGCPECHALYGINPTTSPEQGSAFLKDPAWGEKLWIMHRDMALRLKKDRPGKKLMLVAYSVTRPPPTTFDSMPDNVIIELTAPTPERLEEWSRIDVPGGFAVYTYNWGRVLPRNSFRHLEDKAKLLREYDIQLIQNNLKPRAYGLEGVNVYVFRRMINDPNSKSAEELFEEYISAAYGEVAGPMRQFFRRLNQRLDFIKQAEDYSSDTRNSLLGFNMIYTPELLNTLEELLSRAESTATNPTVKKRLEATRVEFDNVKHFANTIQLYYAYLAQPDQQSLNRVLDALEKRKEWLAVVTSDDKNGPFKLVASGLLKDGRGSPGGEPFNWNIAEMRAAKNPWEKQKSESISVPKTTEKEITLTSPVWKTTPSHTLQLDSRQKTPLKEETKFQLLYDDKNLYVRFEGGMDAKLMDSFHPRGRDSELWLQESLNILLSPEGDKSQYYYLSYEPVANSFIDANHGFIMDPLHPAYGWNDQTWDGDWTYENKLDPKENKWSSMAVIPFETLGTTTPQKGNVWAANFGRIHYKDILTNTDHTSLTEAREVSVWTGLLNASKNPGDAVMGDLIFQ